MVGGTSGRRGQEPLRTYRCAASQTRYKGDRCEAGANTVAEPLEALVREALREAYGERGWTIGGESEGDLAGAEHALDDAESELEAFGSDLTARRAFGARYHDLLQARADAVERAQDAYRTEAAKQARQTRVLSVELLGTDDPAELRELFDAALSAVVVTKGRGPIAERVRLLGHGDDGLTGIPAAQDAPLSGN